MPKTHISQCRQVPITDINLEILETTRQKIFEANSATSFKVI